MQNFFTHTFRFYFPKVVLTFLLLTLGILSSCGYQLHADMPSILGDGSKTLKVKSVTYPTLDAWLPYYIRSSLRDEIGARKLAVWVDSGTADYEISLNVTSFTSHEWMTNEDDGTVLFSNRLTLEAIVYDGKTNKEVWRSGNISYDERLENTNVKTEANELITQIIRQLCDKLRNSF